MTVEELIKELQKIEDKTLDVRLEDAEEDYFEEVNKWLEELKYTIKVVVDTNYMARLS